MCQSEIGVDLEFLLLEKQRYILESVLEAEHRCNEEKGEERWNTIETENMKKSREDGSVVESGGEEGKEEDRVTRRGRLIVVFCFIFKEHRFGF